MLVIIACLSLACLGQMAPEWLVGFLFCLERLLLPSKRNQQKGTAAVVQDNDIEIADQKRLAKQ